MLRIVPPIACAAGFLCLLSPEALAQDPQTTKPTRVLLDSITERGRRLAEYDWAAWHGTDAVLSEVSAPREIRHYVAEKRGEAWVVSFGYLTESRDTFLVLYQALEDSTQPHGFRAQVHDPPWIADGFPRVAARALATAWDDFGSVKQRYNTVVLPRPDGSLYVYLMPGQTSTQFYWHGGDARYVISADGSQIIEKRRLHQSIIQLVIPPTGAVAGVHTAIVDDVPEDTDVFYVVTRSYRLPEVVVTEHYEYHIHTDGTIQWKER